MNLLLAVLLIPLLKIVTWVAVSFLRLLAALYLILFFCLCTYFLLMAVSAVSNLPMPWLVQVGNFVAALLNFSF